MANSREVTSNQLGPHDNLTKVVTKHLQTEFRRPISAHNYANFQNILEWASGSSLIFDSGCGNGKSTLAIARNNPQSLVIGIDKSTARLSRTSLNDQVPNNAYFVRADLIDFYRLASSHNLKLERHFMLYPNPWPKKQHLQRRWHGSPIFPAILGLGGTLELRSNWRIYLEEMSLALAIAGFDSVISPLTFKTAMYMTDFEAKYHLSGQQLYRLTANLS